MDTSTLSLRQAHRLFQVGILLFLLAAFVGLAIPLFAVPRLGLSAHLLGLLQGIFVVVIGLLWPKLTLGPATSRAAFWLLIYSCIASLTAGVLAAAWGAGRALFPIAAGAAQGSPFQEGIIAVGVMSAFPSLIIVLIVILWGLRTNGSGQGSQ